MKETLDKLWNEYFWDECAAIDTDEERRLTGKIRELREKITPLLNKDQEDALEKYVDALREAEALFTKKAFYTGCKFAVSFLLETESMGK